MCRKTQFKNRFTDLSPEINHIGYQKQEQKIGFHPSNRRSLLSEFEHQEMYEVGLSKSNKKIPIVPCGLNIF
jgi:hypothetical protein